MDLLETESGKTQHTNSYSGRKHYQDYSDDFFYFERVKTSPVWLLFFFFFARGGVSGNSIAISVISLAPCCKEEENLAYVS